MKQKNFLLLAWLLISPAAAFAQRGAAPPAPGTPNYSQQVTQAANSAMQNPTGQSSQGGDTMWERLLNSDNLGLDSENGIFQWRNNKFDIGNNLIVRSRFERYLSSPGFGDNNQDYQAVLKQISELLTVDPSSPVQGDRVYQAWQLLFKAAKFPQDGGASESLANQVFNAWRVRGELLSNQMDYADLDRKRKVQEDTMKNDTAQIGYNQKMASGHIMQAANLDMTGGSGSGANPTSGTSSSGSSQRSSGRGSAGAVVGTDGANAGAGVSNVDLGLGSDSGGGAAVTPSASSLRGAAKATFDGMDLAKTYAKQSLLDAEATGIGLQAELQYQTQAFAYLIERRFQHSLIAGQFYEHIFKGSKQRVLIGQQQMSRYMSVDNGVPSMNSFEFLSHEAITETDNTMKSVDASYNDGQRWTALQQLQQAFLLGEMLPSVQDFDPAKRKVLLSIYRESTDLKHLLDMRDYGTAEETVKKIQTEAPDFNGAAINSAIQQGKQLSNLSLMAAQQAASRGDSGNFTANLEKAIALWPLNPEIDSFAKGTRDRADIMSQAVPKFDDMLAHGDDRKIFEARHELGLAVFKDPVRSAKLKDIVDRMAQVEASITYADNLLKRENGYAAWETLADAAQLEPDDPVLARAQRQVSSRVPNYVALLDSAERAKKDGDYAVALNCYLQAQDMYPASKLCHDGIDSSAKQLLAKLNPSGQSAQALLSEKTSSITGTPLGSPTNDSSSTAPAGGTAGGNSSQSLF